MVSFNTKKFLILWKSNWPIFPFFIYVFGVMSKKLLPNQCHEDLFLCFLQVILYFPYIYIYDPFELIIVGGKGQHLFFYIQISSCLNTICCEDHFFLIELSWHFAENYLILNMRIYFYTHSIPLISTANMMELHCVGYCSLKFGKLCSMLWVEKYKTLFFLKIVKATLDLQKCNMNLNMKLSISTHKKF